SPAKRGRGTMRSMVEGAQSSSYDYCAAPAGEAERALNDARTVRQPPCNRGSPRGDERAATVPASPSAPAIRRESFTNRTANRNNHSYIVIAKGDSPVANLA